MSSRHPLFYYTRFICVGTCSARGQETSIFDHPYTPVLEYISNKQRRLLEYPNSSFVFSASDSPIAEREFAAAYPGPYFSLRHSQDPALRRLASSREYDQKESNDLSSEERSRSTKGITLIY